MDPDLLPSHAIPGARVPDTAGYPAATEESSLLHSCGKRGSRRQSQSGVNGLHMHLEQGWGPA